MAIDVMTEPGKTMKRMADALQARQATFTTLTGYLDGNAPLPEGARKLKAAYQTFQKRARLNLAPIIVEAPAQRMIPCGFRVGDSPDFDAEAWRIWTANEMGSQCPDVHRDMFGLAYGYVIVGEADESGVPVITREDPRQCITEHHPLYPSRVTAALKMYRDVLRGKDYAVVYLPGYCYVASRPIGSDTATQASADIASYDWDFDEWVNDGRLSIDTVPVVAFPNAGPLAGKPMAEFEPYIDSLERINYMTLQRLVIVAMQAYRQRAIKGGEFPPTEKGVDAQGAEIDVPIDYDKVFEPGAGALWLLEQGADLWESQPTDISQLLTAVKDDVRYLAAMTATPLSMLAPDAQNQSAEGAAAIKEALIAKVVDRQHRAGYAWNRAMQLVFAFMGRGVVNVETEWTPAALVSLSERADAYSKAADMPFETKLREIMQYPPDKVARILQERTSDTFNTLLAAPVAPDGV